MKAAAVITLTSQHAAKAGALAASFALPHIDASGQALGKPRQIESFIRSQLPPSAELPQFVFLYDGEGLSLARIDADGILRIRADFHGATSRYRREKGGGKGQMIAKAVGLGGQPQPSVLDATAGLGRDAFVLASLGCCVTMLERVPEVRALLADGLAQAAEWGRDNEAGLLEILDRMQLIEADAVAYMRSLRSDTADGTDAAPDIVYLDPMFPPRNKSAQVKKEMRVFHDLVGTDPDAAELLPAALDCARKRVVVKRPRHSPTLGAVTPSHTLEGKSNRFDVYVR